MSKTHNFSKASLKLSTGSLSYYSAGRGHDVVYLHPASGMRISQPLERLANRFRVWAPIVPGFDGTPSHDGVASIQGLADLLAEFVRAGPGRASDIVGSSLGGWLGAWFAIKHPDLVEHLVLAAPAGYRAADAEPLSFDPEVMRKQLYAYAERIPQDEKTAAIRKANGEAVALYGLNSSHDSELQKRIGDIDC